MSWHLTCDACGDTIDQNEHMVELKGTHKPAAWATLSERDEAKHRSGYVGHYHADCWGPMMQRIMFIHDLALDAVPSISAQAVGARRRKHTKAGGGS